MSNQSQIDAAAAALERNLAAGVVEFTEEGGKRATLIDPMKLLDVQERLERRQRGGVKLQMVKRLY